MSGAPSEPSTESSRRTSRRSFMKTAAGATAATVAAAAVHPAASGAEGAVRVGVVGTGHRGCELIRHLATMESVRVAAVCDDFAPHLSEGRSAAGNGAVPFKRYYAMLDGTELDAVVVATPLTLHYDMCAAAVDRGLAVYCENMMCFSLDESKRLARQVAAKDAIFQVGLQRRSNPIYENAKAFVDTGILGDITAIKCQWHLNDRGRRPLPVDRVHPDFDALERRINWRLHGDTSQGLMAEFGSHQLDVANRLLKTAPRRVMAMGGIDTWRDGRDVNDNVYCTYEYEIEGGANPRTVRATYSSIQSNAYEGVSELVMGTKGTLLLTEKKGLLFPEGGVPIGGGPSASRDLSVDGMSGATTQDANDPWARRGRPIEIDSSIDGTLAHLQSFVSDVQAGNRATACTARMGLENAATVLMANEAMAGNTPAAFPEDCRADHA